MGTDALPFVWAEKLGVHDIQSFERVSIVCHGGGHETPLFSRKHVDLLNQLEVQSSPSAPNMSKCTRDQLDTVSVHFNSSGYPNNSIEPIHAKYVQLYSTPCFCTLTPTVRNISSNCPVHMRDPAQRCTPRAGAPPPARAARVHHTALHIDSTRLQAGAQRSALGVSYGSRLGRSPRFQVKPHYLRNAGKLNLR